MRRRQEGSSGFVLEFNGPRREINSSEGNPLDPEASRRGASRRRCLHYFNGVRERYTPEARERAES